MSNVAISSALKVARRYANGGAVDIDPSMKQRAAGNYKMRHIIFQGLQIAIENPKGTIRKGVDHTGHKWATEMKADYGYINGTKGKDGDQVDCFIGPHKNSDRVFVIDQTHSYGKETFDEHKCMLGYKSKKKAFKAYKKSYGPDYGSRHKGVGVTELTIDSFKEWLKGGGGKYPIAPDVPGYQEGGAVEGAPDDTEVNAPPDGFYGGKMHLTVRKNEPPPTETPTPPEPPKQYISDYDMTPHELADWEKPGGGGLPPPKPEGGLMQTIPQGIEMLRSPEGRSALGRAAEEEFLGPRGEADPQTGQPDTRGAPRLLSNLLTWLKGPGEAVMGHMTPDEQQEWAIGTALGMVGTGVPGGYASGEGGLGVAGGRGRPRVSPEAISKAQEMANKLIEMHGNDVPGIMGSLDQLHKSGIEGQAIYEVVNQLPQHIQDEIHPKIFGDLGLPPAASQAAQPMSLEHILSTHTAEQIRNLPVEALRRADEEIEAAKFSGDPTALDSLQNKYTSEWNALDDRLHAIAMDRMAGDMARELHEDPFAQIPFESEQEWPGPSPAELGIGQGAYDEAPHPQAGEEQAFLQKFDEHIAPHMDRDAFYRDFFGGMYRPDTTRSYWGYNGFVFDGLLHDPFGSRPIGSMQRIIDPESKSAYHAYLRINPDSRGKGRIPSMLRSQIELYQKMGINRVEMTANIDVGGYAWAKYGWLPGAEEWAMMSDRLIYRLQNGHFSPSSPAARAGIIKILQNPDPKAMWALSDARGVDTLNGFPIGKSMLAGSSWHGTLRMDDSAVLARFYEYVARKREPK